VCAGFVKVTRAANLAGTGLAQRNGEGTRAMSVSKDASSVWWVAAWGRILACKLRLDSETQSWVSWLLSVDDAKSAYSNMFGKCDSKHQWAAVVTLYRSMYGASSGMRVLRWRDADELLLRALADGT
jgi:hypothetical protein